MQARITGKVMRRQAGFRIPSERWLRDLREALGDRALVDSLILSARLADERYRRPEREVAS